jgi:hypothetical protein
MDLKTCTKCNLAKNMVEFAIKDSKSDTKSAWCKECQCIYSRKHYTKNRSKYIGRARTKNKNHRLWFNQYKETLSCSSCKTTGYWRLAFHHLDPSEKEISISTALSKGWSKKRMDAEIDKCIVLCHNCHSDIHHTQK